MFKYENKEFRANSLSHAYTKFLDESWGSHYVDYLKQNNLEHEKIYATEDIEEVENLVDGYYRLKQKLEMVLFSKLRFGKTEMGRLMDLLR